MKKVLIVAGLLAIFAIVALIVSRVWKAGDRSEDAIEFKMGTFDKVPPSEKNFKVNDINITFEDEKTNTSTKAKTK